MTRTCIATILAGAIGLGLCTPALAEDWRHQNGYGYDWRDANRDGRVDWRDDRNHDGRIDWRDRNRYDPRDRNRDGRVDWRDRYDARDRNYDGRVDWRDGYGYQSPPVTYGAGATCTYQTSRGPVAGYKPAGKDRCCIQTSYGPSCQ
ncbi:MAG TPA: hypothetical protein VJ890_17150 [Vineibacter sp.]|nr:hypothetical protein [Vineibacter sp.]